MKLATPPELPFYLRESFTRSSAIQFAITARIEALEQDKSAPELDKDQFNRNQRTYIKAMAKKRLGTPELQRLYIRAMNDLRQVLSRPEITDLEFDTYAPLAQPEMLKALASWEYPSGSRGPAANATCAKALMIMMVLGCGIYVRSARRFLLSAAGLQRVFAAIEERVAALAGRQAKPCRIGDYTVALDQIEALCSTGFKDTLLRTNIEMFKQLQALHPNGEVAVYAAVDGTKDPAWVRQVGLGETDEEELAIRARTPLAGARSIGRNNEIVTVVADNGKKVLVETGGKFWRGYYAVALVCVKTGMPIVWTLMDANALEGAPGPAREAEALSELLVLLYELWPDCPLKFVVADKAWDLEEFHRICLTQFGVHLIAIQKDDHRRRVRKLDKVEHENIAKYNGRGEVFCRHHDFEPMTLAGYEFASRDGLMPGKASDFSKFRIRYRCRHCARTYSLPQRGLGDGAQSWNTFSFLPHSPLHPRRYALRKALESRRNTVESVFASLKIVSQLALQGPARTRLTDFDTVVTLTALSFTVRNAQVLAAERIRVGQFPSEFPPDLLDGREMLAA
jgi:hypothetical protein